MIPVSHTSSPTPRVVLHAFPGSNVFPRELSARMAEAGITLDLVRSSCALYRLLLGRRMDIVLVDAAVIDDDGAPLVRNLRNASTVGIVAGVARQGMLSPSQVVDWGADAWVVDSADADTVIATVRGLARRMDAAEPAMPLSTSTTESAPPAKGGHWRLDTAGWCLLTPDDQAIALTSTERAVLAALIDAGGSPLSREDLMRALDDGDPANARRRLEMLVFRLRRKVHDRSGLPLPLLTARGNGYLFLDHNGMSPGVR
ncbi:winged helix-turn-helix domain-containing protein [Pinirhizobacter soli]|uniref:winged helix-turn-helix domain-containing protein n=1 Tax=Pinirhizobacter soli TaxID=2786953 RepID=UPI002029F7E1|nr:winged helix-turn-helix domain-containing protein [Pinirhizobacter soli]